MPFGFGALKSFANNAVNVASNAAAEAAKVRDKYFPERRRLCLGQFLVNLMVTHAKQKNEYRAKFPLPFAKNAFR